MADERRDGPAGDYLRIVEVAIPHPGRTPFDHRSRNNCQRCPIALGRPRQLDHRNRDAARPGPVIGRIDAGRDSAYRADRHPPAHSASCRAVPCRRRDRLDPPHLDQQLANGCVDQRRRVVGRRRFHLSCVHGRAQLARGSHPCFGRFHHTPTRYATDPKGLKESMS
jgi:hypothetical protein